MFNKKLFNIIIASASAASMFFSTAAIAKNAQETVTTVYNNIKIVVDGKGITPKDVNGNVVDPFIIDGTTYLPVRALAGALGKNVDWDASANTVIIGGDMQSAPSGSETSSPSLSEPLYVEALAVYKDIKISVNGSIVTPKDVNGNIVEPFIIDGTTYLPVRALADALGEKVDWDADTKTVIIGEKAQTQKYFKVDSAILKQLSDKTLATVDKTPVKAAFYNIYVAANCNDPSFQMVCDNYAPDKTLQTLTIDSVPVAKALTDIITDSFKIGFALYNYAENNGFTKRTDVQEALASAQNSYRQQFETEEEYNEFLNDCGITSADYENFVKVTTVASLFSDDLYSRYANVPYADDELIQICKEKFVTAKHILVSDESTAKDIIAKINSGTSFDELADEHNIDPGYTPAGYTFTYGQMVKEFEDAAFNLKEHTYTKTPVKTSYGYHVIYRLPIDNNWILSNRSSILTSLAESETNNVIENIAKSSKFTLTSEYSNYVNTIK